jgi:protease IV
MDFARKVWKLLVAIKDGLALLFLLLFFTLLFGLLSGTPNTAAWVPTGALVLELDGTISEQPAPVDPLSGLFGGSAPIREHRASDLVRALNAAAADDRVQVVVLDLDRFLGGGQVALGDVAAAIGRVRATDKRVLAYATGYSADAYQLAAQADEIWTSGEGGAIIAGPGGSNLYYRGLIDRLGVTANIYRVGTFKSAVEPFLRADQSPEAEAAAQAYAGELWTQWRQQVARARPRAQIDAYIGDTAAAITAADGNLAQAARRAGLVDRIGNRLQFGRRIAALTSTPDDSRPWRYPRIAMNDYILANPAETGGERIAVVPVVGEIVDGEAAAGTAGGDTISRHILEAVADDSVKAIVLRIDSPGGSVLASEQIRAALLEARARELPVVVSMANVAASGGYWIATPANRIFAEPDTITGSIGVFAILPSFERALGNIGVTADGITTTPLSGQPDIVGGVNPAFNAVAQSSVEAIYDRFTGLVARSRNLPVERVREMAEGRVWAGGTARQLGLVDRFGGLEEAVAEAARLAEVDPDDIHLHYFEDPEDPFSAMLRGLSSPPPGRERTGPVGLFAQTAWARQARLGQVLTDMRRLLGDGGVQAFCLECGDWRAPRAMTGDDARVMERLLLVR